MTHHNRGFSLLEIAIVLTIVALLMGGIMAGQALVRNGTLRSALADTQTLANSFVTFQEKYQALPGDMPDATQYWGVLAGTGSDTACQNTSATGAPTCNGNGNGLILTSAVTGDEAWRAWQHLANAGLIPNNYTGVSSGTGTGIDPGINVPATKLDEAGLLIRPVYGAITTDNIFFTGTYNATYLELRQRNSNGVMTPQEAWSMDRKVDDGLPGQGDFLAPPNSSTSYANCTTGTNPLAATYALDASGKGCVFDYKAF